MRMKLFFFFFALFCASAEILPLSSMHDLAAQVKLRSERKNLTIFDQLYVFDLDDTIFAPKEYLGGSTWYYHELNLKPDFKSHKILTEMGKLYTHLQIHLKIETVEKETPKIIHALQNQGIRCLALTSRSPFHDAPGGENLIALTLRQLNSINVNFDSNPKGKKFRIPNLHYPAYYSHGVIFNSRNNKGKTLLAYLKQENINPKQIIYVDDSLHKVENVNNELEKIGLDALAFHYHYFDTTVEKYQKHLQEDPTYSTRCLKEYLDIYPYTS